MKTIAVWTILLGLAFMTARWRSAALHHDEAVRLLEQHGGAASLASALYLVRTEGRDGWGWFATTFLDYVEAVDLSVNARPRQEERSTGTAIVPPVNDATLELLGAFRRLKQLNLRGAEVTDAGLQQLLKLHHLEKLDVSGARVTAEGVRAFRRQHPNCQVINDEAWEFERSPLAEEYWLGKKMGL